MKIKWKSIIKKTLIVIASLLLLGFVFANIDYNRTKKNKPPILAVYVGKDQHTKADLYYGLFYTVIRCPENENNEKKYVLYFLDTYHVCAYSYDIEVAPLEETNK